MGHEIILAVSKRQEGEWDKETEWRLTESTDLLVASQRRPGRWRRWWWWVGRRPCERWRRPRLVSPARRRSHFDRTCTPITAPIRKSAFYDRSFAHDERSRTDRPQITAFVTHFNVQFTTFACKIHWIDTFVWSKKTCAEILLTKKKFSCCLFVTCSPNDNCINVARMYRLYNMHFMKFPFSFSCLTLSDIKQTLHLTRGWRVSWEQC